MPDAPEAHFERASTLNSVVPHSRKLSTPTSVSSRPGSVPSFPNNVQFPHQSKDVELPAFTSHVQFVQDWEAGRLESSALKPFVVARGAFVRGQFDRQQRDKFDPRSDYAAKIRKEHREKISETKDWWLSKDGRKRLLSASSQGGIPSALRADETVNLPPRLEKAREISRHSTTYQRRTIFETPDANASLRDIKVAKIPVGSNRSDPGRSSSSSLRAEGSMPAPEESADEQDELRDWSSPSPTGALAENEAAGYRAELRKYVDKSYRTRTMKESKMLDTTDRIFTERMNRIQTKISAGEHHFSQAYRQRDARRRDAKSYVERLLAVQSVYSARKWRCRPVVVEVPDILCHPMRFTLITQELFDELGGGSRLLRPEEWAELEKTRTSVGQNRKVLELLESGNIKEATARSVLSSDRKEPEASEFALGDFEALTLTRSRTRDSLRSSEKSLFPSSSLEPFLRPVSSQSILQSHGRSSQNLGKKGKGRRSLSAGSFKSTAQGGRVIPDDVNGRANQISPSEQVPDPTITAELQEREQGGVEGGIEEGKIVETENREKPAQGEEEHGDWPVQDENSNQSLVNPLDVMDDENLAALIARTPISVTVLDAAKQRLGGDIPGNSPKPSPENALEQNDTSVNTGGGWQPHDRTEAPGSDMNESFGEVLDSDDDLESWRSSVGPSRPTTRGSGGVPADTMKAQEVHEQQLKPNAASNGIPSNQDLIVTDSAQELSILGDVSDRHEKLPPSPVTTVVLSPSAAGKFTRETFPPSCIKLTWGGYEVGARVSLPDLLGPQLAAQARIRSLRWALQMLSHACQDKLLADAADCSAGVPRSRFPLFLRLWANRRFGIPSVADQNLVDICATLQRYKGESLEAKLLWHCVRDKLSAGQVALLLNARELLASVATPSSDATSAYSSTARSPTVPLRFALAIAAMALSFASPETRQRALQQLSSEAAPSPWPIGLWQPEKIDGGESGLNWSEEGRGADISRVQERGVGLDMALMQLVSAHATAARELRQRLREDYEDTLDEMARGLPRDGCNGRPHGSAVTLPVMMRFVEEHCPHVPPERFRRFLEQMEDREGVVGELEGRLVDLQTFFNLDVSVDLFGYDTRWEQVANGELRLLVDESRAALWAQHNLDLSGLSAPRRLMKASMVRIAKRSGRRTHRTPPVPPRMPALVLPERNAQFQKLESPVDH